MKESSVVLEASDKQQLIVNGFFRIDKSSAVNDYDLKSSGVWKINLVLNETYTVLTHKFLILPSAEIHANQYSAAVSNEVDLFWKLQSVCINSMNLNEKIELLFEKILPNCETKAYWSNFYSDIKSENYLELKIPLDEL